MSTAHTDTFVIDHLPLKDEQPDYLFDLPELQYPARLNVASLLDRVVESGFGDKPAVVWESGS